MISRRKFLKIGAAGTFGFMTGGPGMFLKIPPATAATIKGSDFTPDVEIDLTATPAEVPILSGSPTGVWRFEGKLLKGKHDSLQNHDDSYLGPTIRVHKGQKVRIYFKNKIPDKSIIHWHGLHVPADMDGHPRNVISQGETYN